MMLRAKRKVRIDTERMVLRPIDPIGKGFARQMIRGPSWLPRGKEGHAVTAQMCPSAKVSMHRGAQDHALCVNPDFALGP